MGAVLGVKRSIVCALCRRLVACAHVITGHLPPVRCCAEAFVVCRQYSPPPEFEPSQLRALLQSAAAAYPDAQNRCVWGRGGIALLPLSFSLAWLLPNAMQIMRAASCSCVHPSLAGRKQTIFLCSSHPNRTPSALPPAGAVR